MEFFSTIGWGIMMDHFKTKGLSPTVAVKVSQAVSSIGTAVIAIIIYYCIKFEFNHLVYLMFCPLKICLSAAASGCYTSLVSIAPSHTGIIILMSYGFAFIGNMLFNFVIVYFNSRVRIFINFN